MEKFISKVCFFCLLSIVLIGCSGKVEEVKGLANDFLEAYFEVDYNKAASMCTDSLSQELLNSVEEIEILSERIKKELKDKAAGLQINITEVVEDEGDKSTLTVFYILVLPESAEQISKSLVVKKVEGEWKVASLMVGNETI